MKASILGGSGYVGGELLRILLEHPRAHVEQATSERYVRRPVGSVHPHLRGSTDLRFCSIEDLHDCDVLFVALPHGESMRLLPQLLSLAPLIIDLTADFRLRDPDVYRRYYGVEHEAAHLLESFVTGCPEFNEDAISRSDRVAVPGCMANAAMLALQPIAAAGLAEGIVQIDARTGSSGSGRGVSEANMHAERSRAMRVFAPLEHRHEAEVSQLTGLRVQMSATAVEAVRGVQVLVRIALARSIDERGLRALYRRAFERAPFVRIIAHKRGTHRLPDPKVLLGSNYCDIGFATDQEGTSLLLVAALDNLVKGAAGNAAQCLNIRAGWPQRTGLTFAGLHPA